MNLNKIAAEQGNMKLQAMRAQWELKKQGKAAEVSNERQNKLKEMQEQFEKQRKDGAIALLDGKLRSGGELSRDELEFLKRENPELYEEALEIKRERQEYKKEIEACKTKKDVERRHVQNINRLIMEAKAIQKTPNLDPENKRRLLEKIEKRIAGIKNEHVKYIASEEYKRLPDDEKDHEKGIRRFKHKRPGAIIEIGHYNAQNGPYTKALAAGINTRPKAGEPRPQKSLPISAPEPLDLRI